MHSKHLPSPAEAGAGASTSMYGNVDTTASAASVPPPLPLSAGGLAPPVLRPDEYRILDAIQRRVLWLSTLIMVPEAVEAARRLAAEGIAANVINVTSPDRLFATLRARRTSQRHDARESSELGHVETLLPPSERAAPIVTVQDASAHSLAFVGGIYGAPTVSLGVDQFGQSGSLQDLYRQTGIGVDDIVSGAYVALELRDA